MGPRGPVIFWVSGPAKACEQGLRGPLIGEWARPNLLLNGPEIIGPRGPVNFEGPEMDCPKPGTQNFQLRLRLHCHLK